VKGITVFVKRDDLFGRAPAPPLGKLRGMRVVLRTLYANDVRLVGCWDTRVSRLGEGLAAACREFRQMRAVVSYPTRVGVELPGPVARAAKLGASVLPLRGNHVGICFAQAKRRVETLGGVMLPFGLECREAVISVAREARRVPIDLCRGTIVLCCGSGVTLAGLLIGLKQLPERLIGVSSGRSIGKIRACIQRYVSIPPNVRLMDALMPYDRESTVECPFPAHPNYDLKAWEFLQKHVRKMRPPVMFWNIGA
jgi:hypothetical protein